MTDETKKPGPSPIVDCDEWLKFVEHELSMNRLQVFPLSAQELRKLVDGWRAVKGVEIAALQRKLDAVARAMQ